MVTEIESDSLVIRDLRLHLSGVSGSTNSNPDLIPSDIDNDNEGHVVVVVEDGDDDESAHEKNLGIQTEETVALPVAAIKSLLGVIQRTKSETMMGLQKELKEATEEMLEFANDRRNGVLLGGRSHIPLASGCELFMK